MSSIYYTTTLDQQQIYDPLVTMPQHAAVPVASQCKSRVYMQTVYYYNNYYCAVALNDSHYTGLLLEISYPVS